jgi:O-acetylhomoserine (thiol)-lyase
MMAMISNFRSEVKQLATQLGADLVGIAPEKAFASAPAGHRPQDILRGARSVIVIAVALPHAALESAPSREYSATYTSANNELNRIAFRLAKFLHENGHRAVQVPASSPYDLKRMRGDISHRHAGELAGLGVFGKNSLLLSPKYGARMRLVSVITDANLIPDKRLEIDFCMDCDKCIRACPVKALKGVRTVDKKACDNQHIRIGKKLDLSGWEQVCGVCIRVCPVGIGAKKRGPHKTSRSRSRDQCEY